MNTQSGTVLNIHGLGYDPAMPIMKQIALRLGWIHLSVLRKLQKKERSARAEIIRRAILEYADKRGVRP